MKATVDPNRCDIAGICVMICPEVFRFHEGSKKAYVTRVEIPKNLEQKCLEAAKKCPNKAIIILRDQVASIRLTLIPNSSVKSKD